MQSGDKRKRGGCYWSDVTTNHATHSSCSYSVSSNERAVPIVPVVDTLPAAHTATATGTAANATLKSCMLSFNNNNMPDTIKAGVITTRFFGIRSKKKYSMS